MGDLVSDEAARKMLDVLTRARDVGEIHPALSKILHDAFNEASAMGWRRGLEMFACEMERGMHGAHQAGIPARECVVSVTEVIMSARGLASEPMQVPPFETPDGKET